MSLPLGAIFFFTNNIKVNSNMNRLIGMTLTRIAVLISGGLALNMKTSWLYYGVPPKSCYVAVDRRLKWTSRIFIMKC